MHPPSVKCSELMVLEKGQRFLALKLDPYSLSVVEKQPDYIHCELKL